MRIRNWLIGLLALGFVLAIASSSWGVPLEINVQGRLMEAGAAVAAGESRDVTFRIYQMVGVGIRGDLWEETQSVTVGDNGVFDVILGRNPAAPLTDGYFRVTTQLFLEIEIGGVALEPAQELVSVPYSITTRNLVGGTVNAYNANADAIYAEVTSGVGAAIRGTHMAGGVGVRGYSSNGYGLRGDSGDDGYGLYVTGGPGGGGGGSRDSRGTAKIAREHGNFLMLEKTDTPDHHTWLFHSGNPTEDNPGRLEIGYYDGAGTASSDFKWGIMTFHPDGKVGVGTKDPEARAQMHVQVGAGLYRDAVYGRAVMAGQSGVYGLNSFGYGVKGKGASNRMGVVGLTGDLTAPSTNLKAGVYGESDGTTSGYGVYARSAYVGLRAYSDRVAAWIEGKSGSESSATTRGGALYVENTNPTFGDAITSIAQGNGVAVKAYSDGGTALRAETDNGTALDLREGSIKINSSTGAGTAGSRKQTAVGVVDVDTVMGLDGRISGSLDIHNSYANDDSLIFLAVMGTSSVTSTVTERFNNRFVIHVVSTAPAPDAIPVRVAYMIIN